MAGLFTRKTDEERAADAARAKAARANLDQLAAEKAFWASPQGQATKAYEQGDEFFQVEIPHSSVTGFTNAAFNAATEGTVRRHLTRTDLLGQIEEAGWHLEHPDWVYLQTGQNSRDKFLASGQQVVVTGEVVGIYLFRRDAARTDRAKPPPKVNPAKSAPSKKMQCFKCEGSQAVATTTTKWVCKHCGQNLKHQGGQGI